MSVFKAILKSVKTSAINIAVYFSIFVLFGNISARATTSTTENIFIEVKQDVAVIDNDNSNLSRGIVEYINATQNIVDPGTDDLKTINDNVRFFIYDYAIIIPEGFSESVKDGNYDNALEYIAPGENTSEYLLTEKLSTYLKDVVVYLNSGYTEDEAIELTHKQMMELNETKATVLDTSEKNHRSFYTGMFTFNGYSLLMILCISVSSCLLFMKDKDVNSRISVSGMHFRVRNAGVIGAITLIGFVLTTFVIAVIALMSGTAPTEKLGFYSLNAYALMVVGLGLAYLISSLAADENLINMLSNMFVLSMSFLSGTFVDAQFLSPSILKLAHFLPLYWYNTAIKYINDTPATELVFTKFGTYLSVELLFAFVFFAAGMVITKKKEQYAF